jgi:long-chain acyl-CoA synthetase
VSAARTTIGAAVAEALGDWGDHPCLIEMTRDRGTVETSSREMVSRIAEQAAQLRAFGVQKGSVVALFLDNSADFVTIFLSLLRIGAVAVPVKMEFRRVELDEIFRNARPDVVIAERHHLPLLGPFLHGAAVLARENGSITPVQAGDGNRPREEIPSEVASINYTYRGCGYPLGAMLTHGQYLHGARVLQDRLVGSRAERMLVLLPMAHIFGLVGCILVPLLNGMTSVIADTMHPQQLFNCIHDLRIDYVTSIPEVHSLLVRLRDPHADLSSLKCFVSGGSLLTAESYERMREAFSIDVLHGYGLTEFAPVSGNMRGRTRGGTVGQLSGDVSCRIDSPGPDGVGEILIKAPDLGWTYYGRPAETREARSGGWFRTGDLGRFDGDCLVFTRELKNTRKVNGNMVDLEEVCRALRLDPDVHEVRVRCEQNELVADLGLQKGIDIVQKAKQIKFSLRGAIAGYKIPRSIGVL